MQLPIYLDYNATTPVDARVLERMLPYFTERFGNASSKGHAFGWAAEEAVNIAREEVAALLGADPTEIYFTGGSTESINMALKGVAESYGKKGRHIVTVQSEHSAVIETSQVLSRHGFEVMTLPVNSDGLIIRSDLEKALTDDTILVSVMWANNEIGTIQPISEISEIVRSRGILLMTDATQAIGKVPVDVSQVDLLACSAHKFYGPKGVGALYVRHRQPRVRLVPLLSGGGQERGLRGGTLNVPGIVGMGAAAVLARTEQRIDAERMQQLRDRLEAMLIERVPGLDIIGRTAPRLPQTSSMTFDGISAVNLMMEARDLAISAGSACSSGTGRPSHVLKAVGLSDEKALATIRFSLGRFTTEEEIDYTIDQIISAVQSIKNESLNG